MSGTRAAVAPASASSVEQFLDAVRDAFAASAQADAIVRDLVVGTSAGTIRIRLRIAATLGALVPALDRHTVAPAGDADVQLYALAGNGGVDLPSAPWSPADYLQPSGELRGCTEGRFLATYAMEGRCFNVIDRDRNVGAFVCADAGALPPWEFGAPLRHLLNWALADRGWHVVHAATAGDEHGAALLVGPGGAGKSTTTFACLRAGMLSVGDDYCAVDAQAEPPVAHALFDTGKLAPDSLARFPGAEAARRPVAIERTKTHMTLSAAFPAGVVDRLALRAIVLVSVAERTGRPVPASPPQALRALAPSTLMQLRGTRSAALAAMGRLTRMLPAWVLPVGPDLDAIPAAVSALLERP